MPNESEIVAPTKANLEQLAGKKVFFGHQSVGHNVLEGLKEMLAEAPGIPVTIEETGDPAAFRRPVLAHAKIGTNKDPRSKIQDFVRTVEAGVGGSAEVALFKFCYVDLIDGDDDQALLADYVAAMGRLRQSYPGTTFVHVTMPLRVVQTGPKVFVKKLIGRPLGGYADNIVRNRYNEGLRQAYSGKEPIFDIAELESVRPDGSKCTFTASGQTYQALCREYSDDGGHLNRLGRRRAAAGLVQLLSAQDR